MSLPEITTRDAWLTARKALLAAEKEQIRRLDALNADRRRLPMVRVDTDYVFTGPNGEARLVDMFGDKHQLVLQHVMFDPAWEEACQSCSAGLDELTAAQLVHLANRDTAFVGVSRASYEKIAAYKAKRGWDFPWYSSYGTSFNYDYHVTVDAAVTPVIYNYRTADELRTTGMQWLLTGSHEMPGVSCFLRTDDGIFHTYSTYARGTDQLGGTYTLLDLTALGRQEEWEEPKGRGITVFGADPSFAVPATSATAESSATAKSGSCDC
jgi:predicted dithiol-disulfide oxidoreductase (DUF899 family)